jgi:hypothetical protein
MRDNVNYFTGKVVVKLFHTNCLYYFMSILFIREQQCTLISV